VRKTRLGSNRLRRIRTYSITFATTLSSRCLVDSAARIKDVPLKRFLYRWHKEYAALSQYTHVTMRKLAFAEMIKTQNMAAQERIREYGIECATRAIYTSLYSRR